MEKSAENSEQLAVSSEQKEFFYDATVGQRYEYTVQENSEEFETAHVYNEKINDDTEYLKWVQSWEIKTRSDSEVDDKYSASTQKFWDLITETVENFNLEGDWKNRISAEEKLEGVANVLAVAIAVDNTKKVRGEDVSEHETVLTETYWNGIKDDDVRQQKHILTNKNREEFTKKYHRIQAKRFKQEKIGGLRRQPKMQFVPQHEAIAKLYDEMMIEAKGFVNDIIPIRFKTMVIHHVFGAKLEKK